MEEELNIREFVLVLLRRWLLIVVVTLAVALFIAWPTYTKGPVYEAKITLMLKGGGSANSPYAAILGGKQGGGAFPQIIKSRAVAKLVVQSLDLERRLSSGQPAPRQPDEESADEDLYVDLLQAMVTFSEKDLFEISAISKDPQLSADIANAYAEAGKKYSRRMNVTEARNKREYINQQLPRVESEMRAVEARLKGFDLLTPNQYSNKQIELGRLQNEYSILLSTHTMLRNEYETAKLNESKELDEFVVVDPAQRPLKPVQKKLLLQTTIGLILGLIAAVSLTLFLDYWQRMTPRAK